MSTVARPIAAVAQVPAAPPQPQAVPTAAPAPIRQPGAASRQDWPAQVQAAAAQISEYLATSGRVLDFRIDGETGTVIVTVTDAQTGDVIRQIPSEEVVRLARLLEQPHSGGAGALLDLTA